MNKVIAPLKHGMGGPVVGDLQAALQTFLDRALLVPSDPGRRRELGAEIAPERDGPDPLFGDGTRNVVSVFQDERQLRVAALGVVDEITANAINALLRELGLLDVEPATRLHVVSGRVKHANDAPFARGQVRAFHETPQGRVRLGEDTTDRSGDYTIQYDLLPGVGSTQLRVVVFSADGTPLQESDLLRQTRPLEFVHLTVPEADTVSFVVSGVVFSQAKAGVNGLRVVIVDKGVGAGDIPLAESSTKENGAYQVTFSASKVRERGKQQPDLQARVWAGDKFVGASEVRYHAALRETLNVILQDDAASSLPSEYKTLTDALGARFKGSLRELKEAPEQQDITHLANQTGWDARAVALVALADQFSARTGDRTGTPTIKPEFFYALFRAGLPANEDALYQADGENVRATWENAIAQGVIPQNLDTEAALKQFQRIMRDRALAAPALVGVSSLKDMLSVSLGDDPARQQQFAEIHTMHRANPERMWEAVRGAFGEAVEKRMRVDGQLAYLTLNNAPLIRKLREEPNISELNDTLDLVSHGYYRAERWQALAPDAAIPPEIEGQDDGERQQRYHELLAAQVRLSYPTAVVAQMVKAGETVVAAGRAGAVHAFLSEHHGRFEIGRQQVEQYLAHQSLSLEPEVKQEIIRIQRVYQITPSDVAMNALLKQGVDSAYAVVQYGEEEFVNRFQAELGGESNARLTYAKAEQVHNTVLNVAMNYLIAKTAPGIGAHSEERVLNPRPQGPDPTTTNDVIAYPTLEKLFGDMDYCACDHCRSILSPAAYLVDLLQFIDLKRYDSSGKELPKTYGMENPLDVLLSRRPDIQHLPLTCENTNTPLPYIDLVNETLEFYVAQHLRLDGYAGHSTDSTATSEELLASPRFVNDAAYRRLAGKKVNVADANEEPPVLPPRPPLPFHQPLEILRRCFDRFEVPLPRAMEALRQSDDLERGVHPYSWRDIWMEELHLSRPEHALLTESMQSQGNTDVAATLRQLCGYASTTPDDDVRIELFNAKAFTRLVGITYEELLSILKTRFVNPDATLIPRLERLGVPFMTLKEFKDGTLSDAEFDQALAPQLDASQYGGDIHAWVKDAGNYRRIMGLLTLTEAAEPWAASTAYARGDRVLPTKPATVPSVYFECTKAGTSAAAEPAWPAQPNPGVSTVTDGAVEWTCQPLPGECSFERLAFRHADPDRNVNRPRPFEFIRLIRFIRLWKKLGWNIEQTDAVITALYPADKTPDDPNDAVNLRRLDDGLKVLLPRLGVVKRVMVSLKLTPERDLRALLACLAVMDTHGDNSFYLQRFLSPTLLKTDPVFADDGYGNFLNQVEVGYAHGQPALDPSVESAASGRLGYNPAMQRLSFRGVMDLTMREALKAVTGVSQPFKDAVDALFRVQRLVTHEEALRAALSLTSDEFALIVEDPELTPPLIPASVQVPYTHDAPALAEAILETAPGRLSYNQADQQLTYRGLFRTTTRDALLGLPEATPLFRRAVQALYAAYEERLEPLTLDHISTIHRHGWLARQLRLSVQEFLLLKRFTGLNPFATLDAPHPPLLSLLQLLEQLRAVSLKPAQALYLLWNQDLSGKSAPDPRTILEFARSLRAGLAAIENEFAVVADPDGQLARARMGLAYGEAATDMFFGLISGTWRVEVPYTHPHATLEPFILDAAAGHVGYDHFRKTLSFAGFMTGPMRAALKVGTASSFEDAVDALHEKQEKATQEFFARFPELLPLCEAFAFFGELKTDLSYTHSQDALSDTITAAAQGRLAYDSARKRLSFKGVLTGEMRETLRAANASSSPWQTAVGDLYTENQKAIAAFFARFPQLQERWQQDYLTANDSLEARRSVLLSAILPDLKTRRKQQHALQTISAATQASVEFSHAMLDAPAVLHATDQPAEPAVHDITAVEAGGLSVQFHLGDTLSAQKGERRIADGMLDYAADTTHRLPANGNDPLSGRWSGYLEAPENGFYNLSIETDAGAAVTLTLDGVAIPTSGSGQFASNVAPIELRAGSLYAISLTVEKATDRVCLRWETQGRGWEVIPAHYLYSDALLENLRTVYLRLLKAAALATALHLTPAETAYLGRKGWWNTLPVSGEPAAPTPQALRDLLDVIEFAMLKAGLAPGDERFLAVIQNPLAVLPSGRTALTALTGWESSSVIALLTHFGRPRSELSQLESFGRIHDGFALARKLRISVSALLPAVTNEPTADTVRTLQCALRARYADREWLSVIKPINDELRSLQRDALVAYILHQMRRSKDSAHIDTPNKLFEFFLMDVEMEPCMQTSRIRHALSSVQLFIERCLMGLESRVAFSSIDSKQWDWRKRYRVWEANRKVFLWPENWLEPELREDASPFFKETMSELLQGDITEDRAATALHNYLGKLKEVAKLDLCGMHHVENASGTDDDVVHLVGRTTASTPKYYYRRRERTGWTPWEHIQLDIKEGPVLPVVWRERLFLFWVRLVQTPPITVSKPKGATSAAQLEAKDIPEPAPAPVTAILNYSERFDGKWQAARASALDSAPVITNTALGDLSRLNLALYASERSGILFLDILYRNQVTTFALFNTHSAPLPYADHLGVPLPTPQVLRRAVTYRPITHLNPVHALMLTYTMYHKVFHQDVLARKVALDVGVVQPGFPLQDPWQAPFLMFDARYAFLVTTTSRAFWGFPKWGGYHATQEQPGRARLTPPLVIEPEVQLVGEVGPAFPGRGFGDPSQTISKRGLIRRTIGSPDTVRFGAAILGPGGAILDVTPGNL